MKKTIALIALICCLAAALSGCRLIKTNTTEVAKDEFAALKKEYETVLAEYDGGAVTEFDTMLELNSYAQMYYYYMGVTLSSDQLASYLETVVDDKITDAAISKQFEARGLALEESEEEIRAEADATWQDAYDYYISIVEGETDEEKAVRAEMELYELGYTQESLYETELVTHQQPVLQEAVETEITEVTDEQLQEAYEAKVAADEETYTATPTAIETAATSASNIICWYPEGYRTVKHILIIPEEDVLQAVTDARNAVSSAQSELAQLNDELAQLDEAEEETAETAEEDAETARTAEEILADIEAKEAEIAELEAAAQQAEQACLEASQVRIDEVYAALEGGASFDDVMAEYGEDSGMQSEPAMTTGYYVTEGSTTWDANFTEGAMALTQVGEWSETPVISTSGIHIIYYNSDVQSGPVALEDVHDTLYDSTLEDLKTEHYSEELAKWIEELHPVYHLENWTLSN